MAAVERSENGVDADWRSARLVDLRRLDHINALRCRVAADLEGIACCAAGLGVFVSGDVSVAGRERR